MAERRRGDVAASSPRGRSILWAVLAIVGAGALPALFEEEW